MPQMHVWDRFTRGQARQDPEGKIVGTRWVYVKKGGKVRCILVAQEFAGSDNGVYLYAGIPPLSATRYLLSDSVSRGKRRMNTRELMVVDIKRASLHGLCTRSIYIDLPDDESERGKVRWEAHSSIVRHPGCTTGMADNSQERHEDARIQRVQGHKWSVHPSCT